MSSRRYSTRMEPIDAVKPYPDNPRRDHDIPRIAESIRAFGFKQPVVVGPDGYVVAGHGRLLAARELGLDKVPVHFADDLTPEQCRAYRIADNRSAEGSDWDERALLAELEMLDEGRRRQAGFNEAEMEELRGRRDNGEAADSAQMTLKTRHEIVVECADEQEQHALFHRLTEEGWRCRVLSL